MKQSQTECAYAEDLNPFLGGSLGPERQKAFLEHLASCPCCPAELESLKEDERLSSLPLTAQEQWQIHVVLDSAMKGYAQHLTADRGRKQQSRERPLVMLWQQRRHWATLAVALVVSALAVLALGWMRAAGGQ